MSRRLVVPPPPAELRALRRAALGAAAANLLALGVAATLCGVLPGSEIEARRLALAHLGTVPFRLLWLLRVPASLSTLVFLAAWSRAVRPGGLAASAVPIGTVALALEVLGTALYAWGLPWALLGDCLDLVPAIDLGMRVLTTVPATGLYGAAFLLLAARSWRARRLSRRVLLGLVPALAIAALGLTAGVAGCQESASNLTGLWGLALVAWWLALARWTTSVGVRP